MRPNSHSATPSDKMQHIQFDGRDCIVMAPEDYDQLERELAQAKVDRIKLLDLQQEQLDAYEARIAARSTSGALPPDELGWLVEDAGNDPAGVRYRTLEQGVPVWTYDSLKALRFARRADAELFAAEDEDAWHVREHMWCGPPIQQGVHSWVEANDLVKWPHCSVCGIIRRADDKNSPCKGTARVGPRSAIGKRVDV